MAKAQKGDRPRLLPLEPFECRIQGLTFKTRDSMIRKLYDCLMYVKVKDEDPGWEGSNTPFVKMEHYFYKTSKTVGNYKRLVASVLDSIGNDIEPGVPFDVDAWIEKNRIARGQPAMKAPPKTVQQIINSVEASDKMETLIKASVDYHGSNPSSKPQEDKGKRDEATSHGTVSQLCPFLKLGSRSAGYQSDKRKSLLYR
eukprot:m.10507 g.10507  ORF g.10507 m.10507 type:complete len:199 (-) comp4271_c0_seq2:1179-1775(-)